MDPEKFTVTEGIMGTFHYHLSQAENTKQSLCGKHTMPTQIPVSAWGTKTHLNEKWCDVCKKHIDKENP